MIRFSVDYEYVYHPEIFVTGSSSSKQDRKMLVINSSGRYLCFSRYYRLNLCGKTSVSCILNENVISGISRAMMRINGRVSCGNRSQAWELSNVPIKISTILDEFHFSRYQWPVVSCAITVVTYAYSEGDVNSRLCLLGSRLWTGLTATVEKKL